MSAYVRRPGWRTYGVVMVAYIAALLSKPMVVTLPFVLLLLDVWPLGGWGGGSRGARERGCRGAAERRTRSVPLTPPCARPPLPSPPAPLPPRTPASLVIEKLPLLLLAAIVSVITYMAQTHAGAVASLAAAPLALRVANALVAYATYLVMMVWPTGLAVFYPFDASLPTGRGRRQPPRSSC